MAAPIIIKISRGQYRKNSTPTHTLLSVYPVDADIWADVNKWEDSPPVLIIKVKEATVNNNVYWEI